MSRFGDATDSLRKERLLTVDEMTQVMREWQWKWQGTAGDTWKKDIHDKRVARLFARALNVFSPMEFRDLADLAAAITNVGEPVSYDELAEVLRKAIEAGEAERREVGDRHLVVGAAQLSLEGEPLTVENVRKIVRILQENGAPMSQMDIARGSDLAIQMVCMCTRRAAEYNALVQTSDGNGRKVFSLPVALARPGGSSSIGAGIPSQPAPAAKSAAQADAEERLQQEHARNDALLEALKVPIDYGFVSAEIVCPMCHKGGQVHTETVTEKDGIDGGKATAGVLTGGVSLLFTGLSRKKVKTQAHCDNCGSTWTF